MTAVQMIFDARSRFAWSSKPVAEELLNQLYDLVKLGPTSMNSCPARFLFLTSQEARERLANHAAETNRQKIISAPCVTIIAFDERFYDKMSYLFPIREGAGAMFASDPRLSNETAFRNGSLQGAYLIVAARLLGLDCCPMSGFDAAAVDTEFLAGTTWKTNFLCGLGYASDEPFPRLPRLPFEEAAVIL